jgi:hypothetical protein
MTALLNSKIYQNFKNMMWDGRLVLYDWPLEDGHAHCDYIQELMELQAEVKSKYIITVQAPKMEGKHDDRADALARMVWAASQNMSNFKYVATANQARIPARHQLSSRQMAQGMLRARQGATSPDRRPQVPMRSMMGGRRGR